MNNKGTYAWRTRLWSIGVSRPFETLLRRCV